MYEVKHYRLQSKYNFAVAGDMKERQLLSEDIMKYVSKCYCTQLHVLTVAISKAFNIVANLLALRIVIYI